MTAREQRAVRIGAAAVGLILAYVVLLDPYLLRSAETRSLVEEREARLARLEGLRASLPGYRERLAAAEAIWAADVAPRLLPSEVPAVAASTLSEEVRRIAAQSFLEVERENVLPAGEEDGLTSVPVQFSLRGDVYGLRDFLAALEGTGAFLHLRELRVNAVTSGFGPTARNLAPLQVTVTLEGYLRGDEAGATTPNERTGVPAGPEGAEPPAGLEAPEVSEAEAPGGEAGPDWADTAPALEPAAGGGALPGGGPVQHGGTVPGGDPTPATRAPATPPTQAGRGPGAVREPAPGRAAAGPAATRRANRGGRRLGPPTAHEGATAAGGAAAGEVRDTPHVPDESDFLDPQPGPDGLDAEALRDDELESLHDEELQSLQEEGLDPLEDEAEPLEDLDVYD